MLKLVVDNSFSRVEGLTPALHKELAKELSYQMSAQASYFSGNFRSRERTLLDKKGAFPSGLLYIVEAWLKTKGPAITQDLRIRPNRLAVPLKATLRHLPYPEQVDAAQACLVRSRGIVQAPTGVGKSLICALIIQAVNVKTLVVVPSLELKRQTREFLESVFGKTRDITVENVDALDVLGPVADYDCVIIDEFHHAAAATYRKLNKRSWKNIYYRFGLSATPFRSKDEERLLLESVLSEVIYKIDYATAVQKGYIVPLEAYYIEIPKIEVQGYTWAEVYKEIVVDNVGRNVIIRDLLLSLKSQQVSTLCLVKEIKHGENIQALSGASFQFANGPNEFTVELIGYFNDGKLPVLLGTEGVLGEGVDTRPCEYVVVAGLGKSRPAFMQKCGRAFRRYPGKESAKVILFLDRSHKWSVAHFKEQCKVLKEEYGVKPVKIELT